MNNTLLRTDVYKLGHCVQYCPGTSKVYAYLQARSDKNFQNVVFFGLQYYLKEYLARPLTKANGEEFLAYHKRILGPASPEVQTKIMDLCDLGYWPLKIKAVPEGTVLPPRNLLMSCASTHPDFYWTPGYTESLTLKVWYPITVASCSFKYRQLVNRNFNKSVTPDMDFLRRFMVHDFGYRGDQTEEGAGISGAAHLLSHVGSDTIPALPFIDEYYCGAACNEPLMQSVPASEHSVMCSYGRENEIGAFLRMLELYPTGIVSIVSDTFNIYTVLTDFAERLKPTILGRDGKVVFRPDSGDPETVICGDMTAPVGSNEYKGAIRLLDEKFGSTVNERGYRVLNPKVGLIYGDGMYYERYEKIVNRLMQMGYAASNLVIGVGGILRNWSRDALGFAIKATYVEINGTPTEIMKDPVTDHGKKSHKGLLKLDYDKLENKYTTFDQVTPVQENSGLLRTVFEDGKLYNECTFDNCRRNVQAALDL